MRNRTIRWLALLTAMFGAAGPSAGTEVYVVCHPMTNVTVADIRDAYLGEKQFAGAMKLLPVDNAAAQADFLSRVIKLDPVRYGTMWTKKSFREGINPPPLKTSDAEVIEFVKRSPGALGYVTSQAPGVTVIGKF